MNLRLYLEILWRRKWILIVPPLVAVVAAFLLTQAITPTYTAAATLRIATSASREVDYGEYLYSTRLMNTLANVIRSRQTINEVTEQFGATFSDVSVSTEFPSNTELMRIVVLAEDPVLAANVANGLASAAIDNTREFRRANIVSVVSSASLPTSPSSPRLLVNLALALVVGAFAGVGLAFLIENLDSTLHSTSQIETLTGLTLLGKIPPSSKKQRYVWDQDLSPHSEAFRRLRTRILTAYEGQGWRTLLFTSGQPGEGKSTIVSNLAFVLAQSRYRVVVVDADMRLPRIHDIFGLENTRGLSDVLQGNCELSAALQKTRHNGVWVVPSGVPREHPDVLLNSPAMGQVLQQLADKVDFVLLDTPAFIAVSDTSVLVPLADAVIMVVARAQAQKGIVHSTCEQLAGLHANVIGVVVNKAEEDASGGYSEYYRKAPLATPRQQPAVKPPPPAKQRVASEQ